MIFQKLQNKTSNFILTVCVKFLKLYFAGKLKVLADFIKTKNRYLGLYI